MYCSLHRGRPGDRHRRAPLQCEHRARAGDSATTSASRTADAVGGLHRVVNQRMRITLPLTYSAAGEHSQPITSRDGLGLGDPRRRLGPDLLGHPAGVGDRRVHHVRPDPEARELERRRERIALQRRLGGAVGHLVREPRHGRRRSARRSGPSRRRGRRCRRASSAISSAGAARVDLELRRRTSRPSRAASRGRTGRARAGRNVSCTQPLALLTRISTGPEAGLGRVEQPLGARRGRAGRPRRPAPRRRPGGSPRRPPGGRSGRRARRRPGRPAPERSPRRCPSPPRSPARHVLRASLPGTLAPFTRQSPPGCQTVTKRLQNIAILRLDDTSRPARPLHRLGGVAPRGAARARAARVRHASRRRSMRSPSGAAWTS